jgi:LysR family transcriptional regulator, benzoate and cis,cis-muconate-responsive activator of ben and cat genes
LAYTLSAMMTTLPAAIRAYRVGHPNVRITLRAMVPTELSSALREGTTDAGVFLDRSDLHSSPQVVVRRLGSLPIGTMLPHGHRLARRAAIAIEEIGDETLILYARDLAAFYDVVLTLCRERGFTPARIEQVDRMETIAGLVAAGEGVSIVPRLYETLRFPGVAYTALTPEPEPFAIVVARSTTANSVLAEGFVEACERLAKTTGSSKRRHGSP